MEYYLAGNQIFRMLIGEILEAYKQERLSVPMTHIVGKKKCGDTRVNAEGIATEAAISQVHESTAGNIVRRGHIFIAIPGSGFGMEEGHFDCGATAVAHKWYTDMQYARGERDEGVIRIVQTIPQPVGALPDSGERDRANAVHQASVARRKLRAHGLTTEIFTTFLTWEHATGPTYEVLEGPRTSFQSLVIGAIRMEIREYLEIGVQEGRTFTPQYATAVVLHDPYAIMDATNPAENPYAPRVYKPHVIFTELSGALFYDTFDFVRLEREHHMSSTGEGSLNYVAFHNGNGHVKGVGKAEGSRIIMPFSVKEERIRIAIAEILKDKKRMELTHGGETIMPVLYNPITGETSFPDVRSFLP
jgi:hypothetical protein